MAATVQQTALDLVYPDAPGFKVRGFPEPSTSQDAAIAMVEKAPRLREAVLTAMAASGRNWTADEMAAYLGLTVLSIRPRFTELQALRRIERTGARRPSWTGKDQWVYRMVTT